MFSFIVFIVCEEIGISYVVRKYGGCRNEYKWWWNFVRKIGNRWVDGCNWRVWIR